MVRRARLGAHPSGGQAVANHLVRLQAVRDRSDDVALALDGGKRDALGVVRDCVRAILAASQYTNYIGKNGKQKQCRRRIAPTPPMPQGCRWRCCTSS